MKLGHLIITAALWTAAAPCVFAGVIATGGNTTNVIDGYRIHTFTNSATASNFVVTAGGNVEVLVVAGGGGGGETIGGGGGGGGVIYSNTYAVIDSSYTVIVGQGGAGGWGTGYPPGAKGGNSEFGVLTAIGGGAGGGFNLAASGTGGSAGGNGGGGGARAGYTPDQGNDGGTHWGSNAGGGGGGAGQTGADGTADRGGTGGDGRTFEISGVATYYGGGGGGGTRDTTGPVPGTGGADGGGGGGRAAAGAPGLDRTGGGGGGGGFVAELAGGSGGSGIVIVRYLFDIDNAGGVTNVTATSAWLNGTLYVDMPDTAVFVYWGPSDGGQDASAWANTNTWAAPQSAGSFTFQATNLSSDATWYYRYAVSNETGWTWALDTSVFITGEVWIEKTADASEIGPTPGTFTVYRAAAATNGALRVTYTVGGTAVNGTDYLTLSGTAIIPQGEQTATIEVSPIFDHYLEGLETVVVTLALGPYRIGITSNATVTITDYGQETRTWGGGGANELASTAINWLEGEAPIAGDAIVLDGGTNKNMTWDINIPVQSWTQDGYEGVVTVATVYPGQSAFSNFTILGDCVISNGVWTHMSNPASVTNVNNELYRLRVTVGGDLIVGAAGAIDLSGKGYLAGKGPGFAANSHGSHGGSGGNPYVKLPSVAPCYGSVKSPVNLGSGGLAFLAGGGAAMFTVSGTILNNGLIGADGHKGGAGGSVFFVSGTLLGNGIIRANGGLLGYGGGGRVALIQTSATDFSGYTGTIEAYTGDTNKSYACCGTIYLEKQGDSTGQGELVIDNFGRTSVFGLATDLNGIEPVTYEFSRITLTNAGCLLIGTGNTVIVHNTVIESQDQGCGIWLSGGTLDVGADFSWSNAFIGVSATGSVFNPRLVASNAVLIVDAPHVITNDLVVAGGGLVTHSVNGTLEAYKLALTVEGQLSILPGGRIDAAGKGYGINAGPGYGYGTSYGGTGSAGKPTYGSILAPTNLGSGGGMPYSKGGGAINLQVSGMVSNDGVISANGAEAADPRPASGGSVYIVAGGLSGVGEIQADATLSSSTPAGGGGRISIILTQPGADFTLFSGTVHAFGGKPLNALNAGAGTVYLQRGTDRPGRGVVWVNHENRPNPGYTDVPPATNSIPDEADRAVFRVCDAGRLRLANDFTVGDIWLDTTNAVLDLGGCTLTVNARKHELGPGSVLNEGAIVWFGLPPGVLIIVK